MGQLYTIGHSHNDFEYFVSMLKKYDVNYLLDVRSVPYSKYAETYNREKLNVLLLPRGIKYAFMGKYFGARPEDTKLYSEDGILDFEKVSKSELFLKGMENVNKGLDSGNNIVLMCTEKDPIDCHRAILVARAFALGGTDVKHILPDGSIQTQQELDERLLDRYLPDRAQLTIFNFNVVMNDEENLKYVYRKRNHEIGYHLPGKEFAIG